MCHVTVTVFVIFGHYSCHHSASKKQLLDYYVN